MKMSSALSKSQNSKKLNLLIFLVLLNLSTFAQNTNIDSGGTVFSYFTKVLPYINGLVAILVFIGGFRGIIKILRSDPEGKTDLMYSFVGAALYAGLLGVIKLLS